MDSCTTRRCLANKLVDKKLITQPQRDNCSEYIYVSSIEYETIKVVSTKIPHTRYLCFPYIWVYAVVFQDTKNLRLGCRLQATIVSNEMFVQINHKQGKCITLAVNLDCNRRNGPTMTCTGTNPFTRTMRSFCPYTKSGPRIYLWPMGKKRWCTAMTLAFIFFIFLFFSPPLSTSAYQRARRTASVTWLCSAMAPCDTGWWWRPRSTANLTSSTTLLLRTNVPWFSKPGPLKVSPAPHWTDLIPSHLRCDMRWR